MPQAVPSRRERQRLETRNRLYAAAMNEFRRVGCDSAQIDKIIDEVGVARGTFYFHFPTKEHVLHEMQRRIEANVVKRLGRLRPRPSSVKVLLQRVIDAVLAEEVLIDDRQLLRDLLSLYVRQPVDLDMAEQPLLGVLTQFFAEAGERGEVRRDLEPQVLMVTLGMLLFGLLLSSWKSVEERRLAVKGVIDFFIRGIGP
jgi:AcrR family transcriptional regulator